MRVGRPSRSGFAPPSSSASSVTEPTRKRLAGTSAGHFPPYDGHRLLDVYGDLASGATGRVLALALHPARPETYEGLPLPRLEPNRAYANLETAHALRKLAPSLSTSIKNPFAILYSVVPPTASTFMP